MGNYNHGTHHSSTKHGDPVYQNTQISPEIRDPCPNISKTSRRPLWISTSTHYKILKHQCQCMNPMLTLIPLTLYEQSSRSGVQTSQRNLEKLNYTIEWSHQFMRPICNIECITPESKPRMTLERYFFMKSHHQVVMGTHDAILNTPKCSHLPITEQINRAK